MDTEKCNINWHTYSDHLQDMLYEMKNSDELTDVTLVCDDKKQFKAHKVVLSACSTVFKSIINDLPHNNSVIYLKGIQHQEMESVLEFMYLGVATLDQERINGFLDVAKNLEMKEISEGVKFNDEKLSTNDNISDSKLDIELIEDATSNNQLKLSNRQLFANYQLQMNEGLFDDISQDLTFVKDNVVNNVTSNSQTLQVSLPSQKKNARTFACEKCECRFKQKKILKYMFCQNMKE